VTSDSHILSFGLITFHFVRNFGGVWQAYALKTFLQNEGYRARIIDYRPSHVELGGRFRLPLSRQAVRSNLVTMYQWQRAIRTKLFQDRQQKLHFDDFIEHELAPGQLPIKCFADLVSSELNDDVLVCGSDQIWNPSDQHGIDPAYFLDFGPETITRCSYAASFGRPTVSDRYHAEMRHLFSRLSAISVREKSGVDIVKSIAGRDAVVLPDPTLLLSDYTGVLDDSMVPAEPYVLTYGLRSNSGIASVAEKISKEIGATVVNAKSSRQSPWSSPNDVYPGPRQWLGLFRNAKYVITNSFHGTVFSILFNRPFLTLSIGGAKVGLDERATNLLGQLGLMTRFVSEGRFDYPDSQLRQEIEWDRVHSVRSVLVAKSRNYFKEIVSREKSRK